jgi:hypothetical protein
MLLYEIIINNKNHIYIIYINLLSLLNYMFEYL